MVTSTATGERPDRPPRTPKATWLGVGLVGGGVVLSLVALALTGAACGRTGSFQSTIWPTVAMTFLDWTLLAVGAVLRARRPDHAMGWVFVAFGFVGATTMVLWAAMAAQTVTGGDPALGRLVAWAGAV